MPPLPGVKNWQGYSGPPYTKSYSTNQDKKARIVKGENSRCRTLIFGETSNLISIAAFFSIADSGSALIPTF